MFARAYIGVWLCAVLTACVTTGGSAGGPSNIRPGERPEITTDEAGLWMASDDVEQRLASSGRVITDPGINDYVKQIVCRLAPEYCAEIRFYIVRTPHFNASMYPNGFMQVWSGLLLRARNEAQLAYVVGHELGHYLRRHGVQRWRAMRGTASAMTFFRLAAVAAGAGYVGDIGYLIAAGSLFAYSREQEHEADDIGFEMMSKAGYEPREAAKIWESLLREKEASDEPDRFIFFSTHPSTEERIANLHAYARASRTPPSEGRVGRDMHWKIIRPFLHEWLRDDLQNRRLASSEAMLKDMIADYGEISEFQFFLGELYRLRDDEGDQDLAISAYLAAVELPDPPPEAHRSLGVMYWRAGRNGDARAAFHDYLRAAPDADDMAMIKSYLNEL